MELFVIAMVEMVEGAGVGAVVVGPFGDVVAAYDWGAEFGGTEWAVMDSHGREVCQMFVVAVGGVAGGFQLFGPFGDDEEAIAWAEVEARGDGWEVVEIASPTGVVFEVSTEEGYVLVPRAGARTRMASGGVGVDAAVPGGRGQEEKGERS